MNIADPHMAKLRAVAPVKICGLTTAETLQASIEGKAAYLGFMFFAKSPRNLTLQRAAELAAPVRARSSIVAVTVDPDDQALDEIMAGLKPDFIQLHGKETPARTAAIAQRTGAGIIKAISVRETSDLEAAKPYDGLVSHLLFDAKPPKESDLPGGVGARFDWTIMQGRRYERPWFLAGGLDPWNLEEAMGQSGAPLIDVSSGVERGPGVKDPALISAFLSAARRVQGASGL
jgi:phosphoribosylanthranilate isomerase